jgi:hypothetical protein
MVAVTRPRRGDPPVLREAVERGITVEELDQIGTR